MTSWILAIDFGTTNSAAALAFGGRVEPLEIEGARRIRSLVVLSPDGEFLVGRAAAERASVDPGRTERTPKRRLGGPPLLLGGGSVDVAEAAAAVLHFLYDEAVRQRGGIPPAATWLTHPAGWAESRIAALVDSARRAGLPGVRLLPEPVAAAVHYAGDTVPTGRHVAVYDLGGGTFDSAVLRRTSAGFEVAGPPGGDPDIGGEEFDHRILVHLGQILAADDPAAWERLRRPGDDREWQQASARSRDAVREAKESLSSVTSAQIYFPGPVDRDLRLTRPEFESLIRDDVEKTARTLEATIHDAGLGPDDIHAVYLVGGSSRIPIVPEVIESVVQSATATLDEPKLVTALGAAEHAAALQGAEAPQQVPTSITTTSDLAARARATQVQPTPPAPVPIPTPVPTPLVAPPPPPPRPPTTGGKGGGRGTTLALVGAGLVILLAVGLAWFILTRDTNGPPPPTTKPDETTTTTSAEVSSRELAQGDCFDAPSSDVVETVTVTDCSEPHEFEAFYVGDYEDDPDLAMPTADDFEAECLSHFEAYVGGPFEESTLEVSWFSPLQENWDDGSDRRITCYLGGWFEPLTFSLENSGY
ncbi:MAG: Hsp70 family protein [Acidimicrobiia bacterium]|nr:Hsp70 family protein [Acidimicrobiia bacterium]